MKITHLSNSFIIVSSSNFKLICDPWAGFALHGGWHSFPEYNQDDLFSAVEGASHIYISHLHGDHFDPDFLVASGLIEKTFVIKKFAQPILKKRLESIGAKNILELESFERRQISEKISVAIVPQITSNSAGADDLVNFDLDTSLVVSDSQHIYFNQVDNPLSADDFKQVRKFITRVFGGRIDIASLVCGAASEFPQCFLGIDRSRAKQVITEKLLKDFSIAADILAPKFLFVAGGNYFIPGKHRELNTYIAKPTSEALKSALGNNVEFLELNGGFSINLDVGSPTKVRQDLIPVRDSIESSIEFHSGSNYDYVNDKELVLSKERLNSLVDEAKSNWVSSITGKGLVINRDIIFHVYKNLVFDHDLNLEKNELTEIKISKDDSSFADSFISIYICEAAFVGCLQRRLIWNQILSGSHCLFRREPEGYEPDLLFSLNYLVA
ncbi:hypothetical protein N9W97_02915 [Pseudomonadales bacterium]|nr:hypothetical protein [Pseudomonadales bacterium]